MVNKWCKPHLLIKYIKYFFLQGHYFLDIQYYIFLLLMKIIRISNRNLYTTKYTTQKSITVPFIISKLVQTSSLWSKIALYKRIGIKGLKQKFMNIFLFRARRKWKWPKWSKTHQIQLRSATTNSTRILSKVCLWMSLLRMKSGLVRQQ